MAEEAEVRNGALEGLAGWLAERARDDPDEVVTLLEQAQEPSLLQAVRALLSAARPPGAGEGEPAHQPDLEQVLGPVAADAARQLDIGRLPAAASSTTPPPEARRPGMARSLEVGSAGAPILSVVADTPTPLSRDRDPQHLPQAFSVAPSRES